MTERPSDEVQAPKYVREVAASLGGGVPFDLNAILGTFKKFENQRVRVLRPGQNDSSVDISAAGRVKSNAACTTDLKEAAVDRELPSTLFPALYIEFSKVAQMYMAYPLPEFVAGYQEIVRVEWDAKGTEARWDMPKLLAEKNWLTPAGYVRRVTVHSVRNHPEAGSFILIDMKEHKMLEAESRRRMHKKNKAKRDAARSGQGQPDAQPNQPQPNQPQPNQPQPNQPQPNQPQPNQPQPNTEPIETPNTEAENK